MDGGPFDLSDATDARMTFYFRGRTELNHDLFFTVSQVRASIIVDTVFRGVGDMEITRGMIGMIEIGENSIKENSAYETSAEIPQFG